MIEIDKGRYTRQEKWVCKRITYYYAKFQGIKILLFF